jgi:hypothetical protein
LVEWVVEVVVLRDITAKVALVEVCITVRLKVTPDMVGLEVAQDAALVIPMAVVVVEG